jgi:hypothetical protein
MNDEFHGMKSPDPVYGCSRTTGMQFADAKPAGV